MDRLEELEREFLEEPFSQEYGIVLDRLERGFAIVSVPVHPEWFARAGMMQGGFEKVAADAAGVYAAMSTIPAGHTRLDHIQGYYIEPVTLEDQALHVIATVRYQGKRNFILEEIVIFNVEGEMKWYGTAKFAKPREVVKS
jgi:acyl-coenzyme A thioesterase PaaI-like protein